MADDHALLWDSPFPGARDRHFAPDVLFIDFSIPAKENASISAVRNLTQNNAYRVYGRLPTEPGRAPRYVQPRRARGLPAMTAVEARFHFA